jgi:hypothetical protein
LTAVAAVRTPSTPNRENFMAMRRMTRMKTDRSRQEVEVGEYLWRQ